MGLILVTSGDGDFIGGESDKRGFRNRDGGNNNKIEMIR